MKNKIDLINILKVGDKVYHNIYDYGEIYVINKNHKCPLLIKFINNINKNIIYYISVDKYGYETYNNHVYSLSCIYPDKYNKDWSVYKNKINNTMKNKINLIPILEKIKDYNTILYSPLCGNVILKRINIKDNPSILCRTDDNKEIYFNKYGQLLYNNYGECILFPSNKNRDWSTFKIELPINTLVMVSDYNKNDWEISFYKGNNKASNKASNKLCYGKEYNYKYIIPYDKFDINNITESLNYNITII